jgi:hypothetical protein
MRRVLWCLLMVLCGFLGGALFCWAQGAYHQPGSAYFSDVSASSPHDDDIGYLVEGGVVSGYSDGTYKPGDAVTREQMASYVNRVAGMTYLLTMCSVDWNYFGGYASGLQAYQAGRITYAEYQANLAAMAWATDAAKSQLGRIPPTARTAPLAATWLKYF